MAITDFQRNRIANREFGREAGNNPPSAYFIALSTTTPTVAGAGFTEPQFSGYARVSVDNNKTTGFENANNGVVRNISSRSFPDSTAPQGTMTHWGIFDTASGGNLLYFGALSEPLVIAAGSRVIIDAGALQFEVGNLPNV